MILITILLIACFAVVSPGLCPAEDSNSKEPQLVEMAEPEAFIGPMQDYEYDLYTVGPDGPKYVPPPELDYKEPIALDYDTLMELRVATDQIAPASREVTIILTVRPSVVQPGKYPLVVTYQMLPATKTVILPGGTATAEVNIFPESSDFYVAGRSSTYIYYFVTRTTSVERKFSTKVRAFWYDKAIGVPYGPGPNAIIGAFWLGSTVAPGDYKVFAVLVPPGADVRNSRNWISNLAQGKFRFGVVR
jgi:hypothetical protein